MGLAEPKAGRATAVVVSGALIWAAANAELDPVKQPGDALTQPLSLATASAAELEMLPGVGPALAERIVLDRQQHGPFRTVAELDRVKGVGPGLLERLEPFVTP